jgi:hypothetical protein
MLGDLLVIYWDAFDLFHGAERPFENDRSHYDKYCCEEQDCQYNVQNSG